MIAKAYPVLLRALGPRGSLWAADPEKAERGLTLFASGKEQPLVTLAMDFDLYSQFAKFDRTGQFLACVTADGFLMVFDLPEINRHLKAIGLGWEEKGIK
jgi:hypothetical protein